METEDILEVTICQLRNNFRLSDEENDFILNSSTEYFEKTINCLTQSKNKYYSNVEKEGLNPFHANTYCVFLYWMSRHFSEAGQKNIADKVYYLNKMLNSVDLYHEIKLPDIWLCEHPLGTVIGRGTFGDKFFFMQRCGIGHNKGIYPVIGNNVRMFFDSKIIGNSHIGNNVVVAATTYIKDQNVPDNVIVFGQSPNLIFKPNNVEDTIWK